MNSICSLHELRLCSASVYRSRHRSFRALAPRRTATLHPKHVRPFASSRYILSETRLSDSQTTSPDVLQYDRENENVEAAARRARQRFGDVLPENHLNADELHVYERLYGSPSRIISKEELARQESDEQEAGQDASAILQTQGTEGEFEAVEVVSEGLQPPREGDTFEDGPSTADIHHFIVNGGLSIEQNALLVSYAEVQDRQQSGEQLTAEEVALLNNVEVHKLLEQIQDYEGPDADEQYDPEELDTRELDEEGEDSDAWPGDEERVRTHPYTKISRFCTSPTTIQFPPKTFIKPITQAIFSATSSQLRQVAERVFDGPGLPYSPATPKRSRTMVQKPLPLQAGQRDMSDMESYVYCATVMPAVYASVLSVLTEIRKRLGSAWMRDMMAQEGDPAVLDAGAGGAGALAWRDAFKAEWQAAQESQSVGTDGKLPVGKTSVLTASDALRHRASRLLDNTTFLPRLPDAVDPHSTESRKQYDVIIATYTVWPIDKERHRKEHIDKLWSLLKPDGGVLVLIEKGVPRGFEVVAGAREHILKRHIADPSDPNDAREEGMIVAPCTNHVACPMYPVPGVSRGRKDWCHFSQRFVRPQFLQRIIGAKKLNTDDVQFSYLAVRRGRDLRASHSKQRLPLPSEDTDIQGHFLPVEQGPNATQRAYHGFEGLDAHQDVEGAEQELPHPLSLPRMILPPLKRPRHVLIDLCTPSGTLERWSVTKTFSRQAYRDARKGAWGDLWALGAKSRAWKRVNLGRQKGSDKGYMNNPKLAEQDRAHKTGDIEQYYRRLVRERIVER